MRLVPVKKDFGLSLFEDWDRFFDEPLFKASKEMGLMRTDIKERENEYVLDIDLPGFCKDDIKVRMDEDYLVVSATKEEGTKQNEENKKNIDETFIRKERFYGSVSRKFYLGHVEAENIHATYQDGILSITVPKVKAQEEMEKRYIPIE